MSRLILSLFLVAISLAASSQKVYYIYLQSEQEQPFFVKTDDEKIHSSTASGYLILSKLRDSVYNFSVGFPQSKWPEQRFTVAMRSKDHGYLLKNFGEKGWGLFDLQTMAVQMSATPKVTSSIKTEKVPVSAFTEILARASDDSTLRERPIIVKEEKKPEEKPVVIAKAEEPKKEETKTIEQPIAPKEETKVAVINPPATKEESSTGTTRSVTEAVVKEPIAEPVANKDVQTAVMKETEKPAETKPAEYKKSTVTMQAERSLAEGVGVVFIDEYEGKKDTIQILIPAPRPASPEKSTKEEKKFLDISSDNTAKTEAVQVKDTTLRETPVIATNANTKVVSNKTCKEVAAEADFMKLRKKMAAEKDDDDMVDEARKYFRTKCFTTLQMKNLGALFLDDLGKYKFFEMAYLFVSDRENFLSLQSELKNDYYINRFKEVISKRAAE
jgi:hypothetical protein